jgi:predicted ATPase
VGDKRHPVDFRALTLVFAVGVLSGSASGWFLHKFFIRRSFEPILYEMSIMEPSYAASLTKASIKNVDVLAYQHLVTAKTFIALQYEAIGMDARVVQLDTIFAQLRLAKSLRRIGLEKEAQRTLHRAVDSYESLGYEVTDSTSLYQLID